MPTSEPAKPILRPYLAAARSFASGAQTPRQFLERSLELFELWEPRIGAFVCTNLPAAREAAERSTARWRAGKPLSPIDGMPVGIKDIIETFDMPTEMGSPLFAGWRSEKDAANVRALRDAGAVILGKTVTTEFAASEPRGTRNPWNVAHTPGGSSSGSAASVAAGIASAALGTQVIGSTIRPASFCGCFGFKPSVNALNREGCHDYQSQSCTGILGASLEDVWQVAHEIVARVGGDAGTQGLQGPDSLPPAQKPRRVAVLETAGWEGASAAAKEHLSEAVTRLKSAGIEIRTRHNDDKVAALETALLNAAELSHRCNGWETRWFLHSMRDRDAGKLSRAILDRAQKYEDMTLADHRADLRARARVRAVHAELAGTCDACITLAAPGGAPEGLASTGNGEFAIPASLLGVPALSLPLFEVDGMPLGLQVIGYFDRDAEAFATCVVDRLFTRAGALNEHGRAKGKSARFARTLSRRAASGARLSRSARSRVGAASRRTPGRGRRADQQRQRNASAGALAISRRHPGGRAQGIFVHAADRRQGRALRYVRAGRGACRQSRSLSHRLRPAARRDRRCLGEGARRAARAARRHARRHVRTSASPATISTNRATASTACRCRSRRRASTTRLICPPAITSPKTRTPACRTSAIIAARSKRRAGSA